MNRGRLDSSQSYGPPRGMVAPAGQKIIACHGVLPGVAGQPWEWRKGKPIEDALYEHFMGMEEKPSSTGLSTSSSLIDLTDFLSGAKVSEDAAATPSSLEDIMDLDPLVDEDRVKDTASDSTTSMDTGALNVGAQAISRPAVTYSSPPAYSKQLQMLHSNQDIQQPSQHAANANIVGWTPPMALTHAVVALPLYLAPVPVRPVWPTFVERLQAESSATFAKPQPGAAIIERPQAGLAARFRESQRAATNIEKPPAELSMRFKALQKENQKPLNAKASEYM
ncbi:hypothetical protein M7I_6680 [Glarea lozoyensis 74030]|uniref:Uncharacterized protein n=1 Tax=Glarea lozoyensis (strain ATCC 74030 / MF5533) TaxID=1104152 RepID=H0EV85_GLAL7|nr:hypothetical protein M7I_6680 [Glarea lozoyensis 74030]